MKLFLKERQDNGKEGGERGRMLISAETGVINLGSFLPQTRGFSSKRTFSCVSSNIDQFINDTGCVRGILTPRRGEGLGLTKVVLGFGGNLGHPMVIVIILVGSWGRSRLISVSVLRLLRVEFVGRPGAELAVLFPVTVVRIGPGCHRDVGREGVCGFVKAVVPGPINFLGFAVR